MPEHNKLNIYAVFLISATVGYISLSQEIIWVRLISYATGGMPEVFGYVLGSFLLGIAAGAWLGKTICETKRIDPLLFVGIALFLSAIIYYFAIPLVGDVFHREITLSYCLVGIIAALLGGIFPVLCHLGSSSDRYVGVSVSRVYLANILGSTVGPIVTGFFLLDIFTVQQNILYLTIMTLIVSALISLVSSKKIIFKLMSSGIVLSALIVIILLHDTLYFRLLEKYHNRGSLSYKYSEQNRSGIIAVESQVGDDIMHGGGMYDGRFNINPVTTNSNIITRAYMIAALHPKPKHVLEIGLGSGSWARVVANHQEVEKLTVVEINRAYVEIIRNYDIQATLIKDPKVDLQFDDGRRWLNRHPSRKFDVILMNTTWHFRNFITNLLSKEFLLLCKKHLNPGGVLYYNTTGSDDIPYTAAKVFNYVVRYSNFIAVSDRPFNMTYEEKKENLLKFVENGKSVFLKGPPYYSILESLATTKLKDISNTILKQENLNLITDDNMATEFKGDRKSITWRHLFLKLNNK